MNCPKCNGQVKVSECFSNNDAVYRIRKCIECGYRFSTEEKYSCSKMFYKLKSDYYKKLDWQ